MHLSPTNETPYRLAYQNFGSGPSQLLLIHGLYDGGFAWKALQPHLDREFSGVAVDLRGHGASSWDRAGRYDAQSYAADVIALVDHLDLFDVTIVGHSLGAEVAIQTCDARPHRMRNLIMIDGGPITDLKAGHALRAQMSSTPRSFPDPTTFRDLLKNRHPFADTTVLHQYAIAALDADRDGIYHMKADPAVIHTEPSSSQEQCRGVLQKLTLPKLLVRGTASSVLPRGLAGDLVSMLRDCRYVEIPKAGHFIPLDNPRKLSEEIVRFTQTT